MQTPKKTLRRLLAALLLCCVLLSVATSLHILVEHSGLHCPEEHCTLCDLARQADGVARLALHAAAAIGWLLPSIFLLAAAPSASPPSWTLITGQVRRNC